MSAEYRKKPKNIVRSAGGTLLRDSATIVKACCRNIRTIVKVSLIVLIIILVFQFYFYVVNLCTKFERLVEEAAIAQAKQARNYLVWQGLRKVLWREPAACWRHFMGGIQKP